MKNRILVIEDFQDPWKKLVNNYFDKKEYRFDFSPDGKNIDLGNYDLIIVDYYLKDGHTGTKWVKDNVKSKDPYIPVIFWTSSLDSKVIKETLIGEEIFFKKDFDLAEFKKAVDKHLHKRRIYKENPLYNDFFNTKIVSEDKRILCHNVFISASKYLESFFAHSKHHAVFAAHGIIHSQNVLHKLGLLLYPVAEHFNEDDYVSAYISAIIHDMGMMPVSHETEMESSDFKKIRSNHCLSIFYWVYTGQLEKHLSFKFNSDTLRAAVAIIVLFHDGHDSFSSFLNSDAFEDYLKKHKPLSNLNPLQKKRDLNKDMHAIKRLCEKIPKLKTIAALVSLADKLDYGPSRIPIDIIRKSPESDLSNEFEYVKNDCMESFDFVQHKNGVAIRITIKKIKLSNDEKKHLNKLKQKNADNFEIFKNEVQTSGNVTKFAFYAASLEIIRTIRKEWNNIRHGFTDCGMDFLENLKLSFSSILPANDSYGYSFLQEARKQVFFRPNNSAKENAFYKDFTRYEIALFDLIFKDYIVKDYKIISTGFSWEKVIMFTDISKKISDNYFVISNDLLVKTGSFEFIHLEVTNYKRFIVPCLDPLMTIGFSKEYKYMDWGAFTSLYTHKGIKNLDKVVNGYTMEINSLIYNCFSNFYKNIGIRVSIDHKDYEIVRDMFTYRLRKFKDKNISDRVTKLIEKLKTSKFLYSLSHGDFSFRNILTLKDQPVFIDFPMTGISLFFLDIAKFEHYLIFEKLKEFDHDTLISGYLGFQKKIDHKAVDKISGIRKTLEKFYTGKTSHCDIDDNTIKINFNLARLYVNVWSLKWVSTKGLDLNFKEKERIVEGLCDILEK
jgi:hypothetical protein